MSFRSTPHSNLAVRVTTALLGIPVVLAVDYAGGLPFALLVALVTAAGVLEFCLMCRRVGLAPIVLLSVPAAVSLAVLPVSVHQPQTAWIGLIVLLLVGAGSASLLPGRFRSGLLSWTVTVIAVLYVGLLLGHLTLLRGMRDGAWWVFDTLVITWAYDTGAYFAGSLLGRRPFMHHISPKKTVEGVLGGLFLSGLAGLIFVPTTGLVPWQGILLGVALAVAAQAGDLVESMVKRQTGVKDSGALVPGHGGILDRIDSLLFTAPLAAYAALLLGYGS